MMIINGMAVSGIQRRISGEACPGDHTGPKHHHRHDSASRVFSDATLAETPVLLELKPVSHREFNKIFIE